MVESFVGGYLKNANRNLAKMNEEIQYFYWSWFSIFIGELKYC